MLRAVRSARCAGEARITPGFNLEAKHVIHAVAPRYDTEAASAPILAATYRCAGTPPVTLPGLYLCAAVMSQPGLEPRKYRM